MSMLITELTWINLLAYVLKKWPLMNQKGKNPTVLLLKWKQTLISKIVAIGSVILESVEPNKWRLLYLLPTLGLD